MCTVMTQLITDIIKHMSFSASGQYTVNAVIEPLKKGVRNVTLCCLFLSLRFYYLIINVSLALRSR